MRKNNGYEVTGRKKWMIQNNTHNQIQKGELDFLMLYWVPRTPRQAYETHSNANATILINLITIETIKSARIISQYIFIAGK